MRGRRVRPAGLALALEVVDGQAEAALVALIRDVHLSPMVMHGTPSRRLVHHYGLSYDAETYAVAPAEAVPAPLAEAVRCAALALGRRSDGWDEVLVTLYPPGSGIGRHRDAPAFGEVIGISLLSPCTMQFESGSGADRLVWEQYLPPRSAYALTGPARWSWRHGIDATRYERVSITARTMRARGGAPGP